MTKPITLQQAFNTICHKAQLQNALSHIPDDPDFMCAYRTKDGKQCFIGMIMPDELYDPQMDADNSDIKFVLKNYPEVEKYFALIDSDTLEDLQGIHDTGGTMVNPWDNLWEKSLRRFALKHHLTIPFTKNNQEFENDNYEEREKVLV